MPCSRATLVNSSWRAPSRISCRTSSGIVMTSYSPVRPLKPVCAQLTHPTGSNPEMPRGDLEAVLLEQRLAQLHRLLAVAQLPHEPLPHHALDAGGHQVRLDSHLHEPRGRERRVVGVQRRHHQVPGERRLDGDLRRLGVADLAHHQHVRVGAQQRAQPGGEREPGLRVHLHLLDAVDLVLHRVLDGHERPVGSVQPAERRVQRRRLARAGRAGHEDRAVGPAKSGLEAQAVRPRRCRGRRDP